MGSKRMSGQAGFAAYLITLGALVPPVLVGAYLGVSALAAGISGDQQHETATATVFSIAVTFFIGGLIASSCGYLLQLLANLLWVGSVVRVVAVMVGAAAGGLLAYRLLDFRFSAVGAIAPVLVPAVLLGGATAAWILTTQWRLARDTTRPPEAGKYPIPPVR